MSLIEDVVGLVAKLPADALAELVTLLRAVLASDDPARELRRRAEADAAHLAAQETARRALEAIARGAA